MTYHPYPHGYGHRPEDEDGIVFEDPWMWELPEEEITDRWRQGLGEDPTPK